MLINRKRILVAALATSILTGSAWAQILVIDAAAITKLVDQIAEMKKQLDQLRATYQVQMNQYNQLIWNAKYALNKYRWKAAVYSWRYPAYGNASGKTQPWNDASKNGTAAAGAWITLASRLPNIVDAYGHFGSADINDAMKKHYARVEIMDATHTAALATLGDTRQVQLANQAALDDLEARALSDADSENTETAILNKINASAVFANRQNQQALAIRTMQADMQLQFQMMQRDAMAEKIAQDAAFAVGTKQQIGQHMAGSEAVLSGFRGL
jgi:hypothetical protein